MSLIQVFLAAYGPATAILAVTWQVEKIISTVPDNCISIYVTALLEYINFYWCEIVKELSFAMTVQYISTV